MVGFPKLHFGYKQAFIHVHAHIRIHFRVIGIWHKPNRKRSYPKRHLYTCTCTNISQASFNIIFTSTYGHHRHVPFANWNFRTCTSHWCLTGLCHRAPFRPNWHWRWVLWRGWRGFPWCQQTSLSWQLIRINRGVGSRETFLYRGTGVQTSSWFTCNE